MALEELKENIKKHYGTSDEDLKDLGEIMDALANIDKVEELQTELETVKLDAEKKIKDIDNEWRNRYRERFFDGDVTVDFKEDLAADEDTVDEVSIEEYLNDLKNEKG